VLRKPRNIESFLEELESRTILGYTIQEIRPPLHHLSAFRQVSPTATTISDGANEGLSRDKAGVKAFLTAQQSGPNLTHYRITN
jgi:hypothetical protein